MLKIYFIILAHKNPEQLARLVARLNSPESEFHIHIDKDVDINPFIRSVPRHSNIFFLDDSDRVSVSWGGIGDVLATLNVLRKICARTQAGYGVLLSGQDYPIRRIDEIHNFLLRNAGTEFINKFPLPAGHWENGGLHRLNRYKISFSKERGDFVLLPSVYGADFYTRKNFINLGRVLRSDQRLSLWKIFVKRKYPGYLKAYGGSQWWMLTTETVAKVLLFLQEHPDYLKYHRYTLLPDEIFFQSIVMALNKETPQRLGETVTYVNWHKKGVPLPATLMMEDLPELLTLPETVLFARKFDEECCPGVLAALDKYI